MVHAKDWKPALVAYDFTVPSTVQAQRIIANATLVSEFTACPHIRRLCCRTATLAYLFAGIDCDSSTLQGSGSACYLNESTDRYYRCEDGLNCQSYARCKYADGSRKSCGICRTAKSSNDDITCGAVARPCSMNWPALSSVECT